MNYKRKSTLAIVLIVMLAVLLTGCATTFTELQNNDYKNSNISTGIENSTLSNTTVTPSIALEEGVTEDDTVISRYYGRIDTVNGLVLYDIATKQLGEWQYVIDLQFYDYSSKELIQQLSYTMRDDFISRTVENPLQLVDINKDGNKDIILDLGIYGKAKLALCYVYDPDQKGYVQLEGFDELLTPQYNAGYIYENQNNDTPNYVKNKYMVNGNKMILVASLAATYASSPSPVYTEKVMTNDELVTVKENVSAEEIDITEWNYSLP